MRALKRLILDGARRAGYEIRRVEPVITFVPPEPLPEAAAEVIPKPIPEPEPLPPVEVAPIVEAAFPEKPPARYDEMLYRRLFPTKSIERKAFYNFGSGDWRHPLWTNIDYDSNYYGYRSNLIDIHWDISSLDPVDVESGTAELVYCSHTVEHLLDAHVDHMLAEARRILKPGGIVRVTTPNIRLIWEAAKRGDVWFAYHYGNLLPWDEGQQRYAHELSVMLVNELGSQLVQEVKGHQPHFTSHKEIDRLIGNKTLEEALPQFSAMIDFALQRQVPGHHVSWWTNEKMSAAMLRAGFSRTIVSVAGGSISPAMRDTEYFDVKHRTCSIFVEGVK